MVKPFLDFVYPGHLSQNVLTTGLIAYKIWKQHILSKKSGVRSISNITLLSVARLVVESAMVYTVQLFILIILFFLQDNFQIIVQSAVVPSVGTSW